MKQHTKYIALSLAVIFCIAALAGCGSSGDTEEETVTDSSESSTDSLDSELESLATEDVIGEVTYAGASYLSLNVYASDTGVTDYLTLDPAQLEATGETETVTLDEDAVYESVSDGALYTASADDIAVGDMIAITTDDSGVQSIIILEAAADGSEENNASEASDGVSDSDYDTSSYSDTDI